MARFLKQSTAVDVAVGPFLDETDGKTPETGLTITQPDILLKKNGAAWAQKSAAQTLSHESNGWYEANLSTTDTDTLGVLMLAVTEAGALPVWHEFMVVTANIYDSLFSTDVLDVSVVQWIGTACATPTVAGVPEVDNTHWLGTAIATPTVGGVPEVDITHFGGIIGSFSSGRPAVDTTHWQGVSVAVPSVAGVPEVDVTHWNGSAVATPNTAGVPVVDDRVLRTNTATAGAASTITLDAGASTTAQLFKGCIIALIGGTGAGQARLITDYSTGRVATVTPAWVTNPASGTLFEIRGAAADVQGWLTTAPNALQSGRVDASVGAMATDTLTNTALAASAVTEIQTGLATSTQLTTVQNKTDLIPGTLDGKTFEQIVQLLASVLLGKVSGMESNAPVFRSINDGANRVSATTDANGNRTAVTLNNT